MKKVKSRLRKTLALLIVISLALRVNSAFGSLKDFPTFNKIYELSESDTASVEFKNSQRFCSNPSGTVMIGYHWGEKTTIYSGITIQLTVIDTDPDSTRSEDQKVNVIDVSSFNNGGTYTNFEEIHACVFISETQAIMMNRKAGNNAPINDVREIYLFNYDSATLGLTVESSFTTIDLTSEYDRRGTTIPDFQYSSASKFNGKVLVSNRIAATIITIDDLTSNVLPISADSDAADSIRTFDAAEFVNDDSVTHLVAAGTPRSASDAGTTIGVYDYSQTLVANDGVASLNFPALVRFIEIEFNSIHPERALFRFGTTAEENGYVYIKLDSDPLKEIARSPQLFFIGLSGMLSLRGTEYFLAINGIGGDAYPTKIYLIYTGSASDEGDPVDIGLYDVTSDILEGFTDYTEVHSIGYIGEQGHKILFGLNKQSAASTINNYLYDVRIAGFEIQGCHSSCKEYCAGVTESECLDCEEGKILVYSGLATSDSKFGTCRDPPTLVDIPENANFQLPVSTCSDREIVGCLKCSDTDLDYWCGECAYGLGLEWYREDFAGGYYCIKCPVDYCGVCEMANGDEERTCSECMSGYKLTESSNGAQECIRSLTIEGYIRLASSFVVLATFLLY